MSDSVHVYLDSLKQYKLAAQQASEVISVVKEVAGCLSGSPLNFMFSGPTMPGMPAEVALSKQSNFPDANRWPTALQIQTTLIDLHQAKSDLNAAWNAVPHDDRGGMTPPPERFIPTQR